jgi:hypothetical protein
VFAVSFMKPEGKEHAKPKSAVFRNKWLIVFIIAGILLHLASMPGLANFLLLMAVLMVFNSYVLNDVIHSFQKKVLPGLMNRYEKLLRWILKGKEAGLGICFLVWFICLCIYYPDDEY